MSGEIVALVVVVVIIFVLAALLGAYLTAHRLDRLHIRTDLARASSPVSWNADTPLPRRSPDTSPNATRTQRRN
ncbi:hypothetical protein ACFSSF_07270 [Dietzia aerolata]|uniref:hypothetical protein n=1 Tax=Dietzia aerolata TaxID=595984 RepID=UPI0036275212